MKLSFIRNGIPLLRGFKRRLTFVFLPYSLFIIALYSVFFIYFSREEARRELKETGNLLLRNLTYSTDVAFLTQDFTMIEPLLMGLKEEEKVLFIGLYDSLGQPLYTLGEVPEKMEIHFVQKMGTNCEDCHSVQKKNFNILAETRGGLDIISPVIAKGVFGEEGTKPIGWLRVRLSKMSIQAGFWRGIRIALFLGLVFIIIGGIIAVWFSSVVTTPLSVLQKKVKEIATGEADLTRRLDLARDDEFGELAKDFNTFIESLNRNIKLTMGSSNRLSEFSENISSSIQELTASSNEVTDTVQRMAQSASESASHVINASRSVKEILEVALTTTDETEEMEEIEKGSFDLAQEGRKISEEVNSQLNTVNESIRSMNESIQSFSSMLRGILEITSTIQSFMKRTNMLSLNASIEAARAGEHGKGFAIVAQEIRKLAEDASEYSTKIQEMVESIETGMKNATMMVTQSSRSLSHSQETIIKAVDQLKKIADQAEEAMERTSKITKLTAREKEEVERLARFMDKVGEIAEQTSVSSEEIAASMEEQLASLEEISASAQELTQVSEELRKQMGRFKTD